MSHPRLYGIILMMLLSIFSGILSSLTHSLPKTISTSQILFLKSGIGAVLLLLILPWAQPSFWKTSQIRGQVSKASFGAMGNFFWIGALQHLPLSDATAISLFGAVLTPLGAFLFLKEKSSPWTWGSIAISILGVAILLKPTLHVFSFHAFFPLGSAIMFAGSSLMTKKLALKDSSITTLFYLLFFMTLWSAVPAAFHWTPLTWGHTLLTLIGIAILYLGIQCFMIEAYTYLTAGFLTPLKFMRFFWATLIGWFFFGESPNVSTLLVIACLSSSYYFLSRSTGEKAYGKQCPTS